MTKPISEILPNKKPVRYENIERELVDGQILITRQTISYDPKEEAYNQCLDDCLKSLQDAGVVVCPSELEIAATIENNTLRNINGMAYLDSMSIAKALRAYLLGKG